MATDTAPFARLLLATEHSEFDAGAERVALALAKRCGLPLSVVMPIVGNAEFDSVAPELSARTDDAAAARLHDLRALAATQGVPLAIQVRRGPEPFREIVDAARAASAELIIIRRRGRIGFLANLLIGEMVSKVVAHAPCSVLVNARGASLWAHRVLVAVDPLAPDLATVATAARVAIGCALPLTLICVADAVECQPRAGRALAATLEQARALGASVDGEVRVGNAHEQIIEAIARNGADLVVLGRQGAARPPRAWIDGVAQKVIGLAECPVLVCVPPPAPMENAS